jgi:hypothetical protein
MGATKLTPDQYHEAVSILVSDFDKAVERHGLTREIHARHETLGDTLYTNVAISGTYPSDATVLKVLYFLAGFANCGLGRHNKDRRAVDLTLKRRIG